MKKQDPSALSKSSEVVIKKSSTGSRLSLPRIFGGDPSTIKEVRTTALTVAGQVSAALLRAAAETANLETETQKLEAIAQQRLNHTTAMNQLNARAARESVRAVVGLYEVSHVSTQQVDAIDGDAELKEMTKLVIRASTQNAAVGIIEINKQG